MLFRYPVRRNDKYLDSGSSLYAPLQGSLKGINTGSQNNVSIVYDGNPLFARATRLLSIGYAVYIPLDS